jgi:enoyl-CoA hydratase
VAERVRVERHGAVAVVELNRPRARNAIDRAMGFELSEAFDDVEDDDAIRAVVLTGAGGWFCAGADLKALEAGEEPAFVPGCGWAGLTERERGKPLVAAVERAAIAGGLELALACDVIVASADAVFGLPEVTLGFLAAAGGAVRLAQAVPHRVAAEMLLTGASIDASRAYELGLVNSLTPPGAARGEGIALARQIAANPPAAVAAARSVLAAATAASTDAGRAESARAGRSLGLAI